MWRQCRLLISLKYTLVTLFGITVEKSGNYKG